MVGRCSALPEAPASSPATSRTRGPLQDPGLPRSRQPRPEDPHGLDGGCPLPPKREQGTAHQMQTRALALLGGHAGSRPPTQGCPAWDDRALPEGPRLGCDHLVRLCPSCLLVSLLILRPAATGHCTVPDSRTGRKHCVIAYLPWPGFPGSHKAPSGTPSFFNNRPKEDSVTETLVGIPPDSPSSSTKSTPESNAAAAVT